MDRIIQNDTLTPQTVAIVLSSSYDPPPLASELPKIVVVRYVYDVSDGDRVTF